MPLLIVVLHTSPNNEYNAVYPYYLEKELQVRFIPKYPDSITKSSTPIWNIVINAA